MGFSTGNAGFRPQQSQLHQQQPFSSYSGNPSYTQNQPFKSYSPRRPSFGTSNTSSFLVCCLPGWARKYLSFLALVAVTAFVTFVITTNLNVLVSINSPSASTGKKLDVAGDDSYGLYEDDLEDPLEQPLPGRKGQNPPPAVAPAADAGTVHGVDPSLKQKKPTKPQTAHGSAVSTVVTTSSDTGSPSIASLAQCLATTTQFDASERCWTVHKQALASAVIAEIEAMPFASRQAFNTLDDWSPHRLILPTHNCNMLKLQRMGAGYSQGHGQIHYDGPKWFCPEFLETPDKAAITPLVPATPERAAEVSAAAAAMATVAPPPCTIFSLGSNGDFSFEQSMRAFVGSACAIHTFDCTGVWSDPSTIFHPWCVSAKTFVSPQNRQYYRIQDLMTKLAITSVELLKIDVEGYEFETLEALALAPVHLLPKQILIEVHFWTAEDMTQFNLGGKMDVVDYSKENWSDRAVRFQKLIASMGYHVAVRELNPLHGCCAEYVLVRV